MKRLASVKRDGNYVHLINESIGNIFESASRIVLRDPLRAVFLLQTVKWQRRAARVRMKWKKRAIHVPPFMLISITNKCNLKCTGCFPRAKNRSSLTEMSDGKLRSLVEEARGLGISFILLAGGEPLVRQELLNITKDFPEIIFPLFTNGLLINEDLRRKLRHQTNVVPLISLEGYGKDTDERRGEGVYERLHGTIKEMNQEGIFFGLSLTLTRANFDTVADEEFIKHFLDLGCKLFFFLEYVPVEQGPEDWPLTEEQRENLMNLIQKFRSRFTGLFFAFPGDEEELGGCLSGRGFVHVDPEGNVEPCPFAPYSDANLFHVSLKEALQSEFLRKIRENKQMAPCQHRVTPPFLEPGGYSACPPTQDGGGTQRGPFSGC